MKAIAPAVCAAFLSGLLAGRLAAQQHVHVKGAEEGLGTVHFATSCRPAVAPAFDRAVALLHSFEFNQAMSAFNGVLAEDSTCAMAYWGIALTRWTNPMAANIRPTALLAQGRRAVEAGTRVAAGATERERGYIAAVSKLFDDYEHVEQPARVLAYERAMADLVAREPADTEAKIFHAIALVAAAPPTDKSYANQLKAGAVLEALWRAQPNHPGLAHYIIHAYDVPALAPQAATAARRYAEIAPGAAHALHMPSHTFTRLGMWEASIETNRRSVAAATRDSSPTEILHASDYMVYAYLQMRRDAQARAVFENLPPSVVHFDVTAVTGAAPGLSGVYALAAMPARYALERRAWKEAAALKPTTSNFPFADALTWFARGLGAAHEADTAAARVAVDSLAAFQARLEASGESYWAEQVAIQRLGAQAWLDLVRGRRVEALAHMRQAARREDATEKNAVTPGPLAPARELLGDMLMGLGRPAEALAEYRRTLAKEPKRFRALDGARRAALAAGDRSAARSFAAQLETLTGSKPPDHPRPKG